MANSRSDAYKCGLGGGSKAGNVERPLVFALFFEGPGATR